MTGPFDAKTEIFQALKNNTLLISLCPGGFHNRNAKPPIDGPEYPRIVYSELKNGDDDYADNEAISAEVRFQISIFNTAETISSETPIAKEVDKTMKSIGFSRYDSIDLYEEDTKVYHKPMRYLKTYLGGS